MTLDPRTAAAEELLQALTVGELTPEDPLVAARLAQDPALQARWHALAKTLADLRELDAGMRGDGAIDVAEVDTTRRVRAFRRAAARRRWPVAIAAAAAALLVVLWLVDRSRRPPPDPSLGGNHVERLTPDGVDWPPGEPLRWSRMRGAAAYRVHVQPLPDGAVQVWPHGPDGAGVTVNEWLPTTEQRSALPERFQWRVVAFDDANVLLDTSQWTKPTTRR